MDNSGHNFDAVGKYREKVLEKLDDPYLIYKVHNKSLDPSRPSFVFKTSKEQLQIAVDMDRQGSNPLGEEYCHLDGNHKRCAGFKTITLWMYHPFLRQMCKIATMEVESENTLAMNLFWEMLNEALQEYTTNPTIRFRPYGNMMDKAGAFWSSIGNIQGKEDFQRFVSCEKHFDFTVLRQEKTLVGGEVKSEFKFLCNSLQKAETPLVFQRASERMDEFIKTHSHLKSWWTWWQKRQGHVFRAFKPRHNVPNANHAEIGHSRWVKIGAVNLSLIDACRDDVAESLKLAAAIRAYGSGAFKGGQGPSSADLRKRRYAEQNKRADVYIEELDEVNQASPAASIITSRETDGFLDPTSSHQHDPVKRPTKGNKGRAVPYRSPRSKAFMRSLEIAKKTKNSFNVLKKVVTTERVETHLKHFTGKIQKVTICTYPDCADCVYCTRQTLCSHILWVYLFVCKLPEASPILQQRALTTEEMADVVSSLHSTPQISSTSVSRLVCSSPGTSVGVGTQPSCSAISDTQVGFSSSLFPSSQGTQSSSATINRPRWELLRKGVRKGIRSRCRNPTCKVLVQDGVLVIVANATWSPSHLNSKGEKFYVPSKFYFCLSSLCCKHQPSGSDVLPPDEITISEDLFQDLTPNEYVQLSNLGLPLTWQ